MIFKKKYINKSLGFELEFDFVTNKNKDERYFSGHFKKSEGSKPEAISGGYHINDTPVAYCAWYIRSVVVNIRAEEGSPFVFKGVVYKTLSENISPADIQKPYKGKIDEMYVQFESEEESFKLLFEGL